MIPEVIDDLPTLTDVQLADHLLTYSVFKETPAYLVGYHLHHGSKDQIEKEDVEGTLQWLSGSTPFCQALKAEVERRFSYLLQEKTE